MSSSPTPRPTPEGPRSAARAPGLPDGFTDTFTSRYVDTGRVRLHAVTGGEGPALLLLLCGWPGSTGWPSPRPPSRDCPPHRRFSAAGTPTTACGTSASTSSPTSTSSWSAAGRALLRPPVRHEGREGTARPHRPAPRRHPRGRPGGPALQLRVLPCAGHDHRAEPAAQGPAADPPRPDPRGRGEPGRSGRQHDAARRGRRGESCSARLWPLPRRGGPGGDAGRADRLPGAVPGQLHHSAKGAASTRSSTVGTEKSGI
ncbi:hypothetical protein SAMN04490356_5801 [Streptomyces melanosporofaciens]|uniref:Uncharacterized protein n=1 Tax=Streptomyces melanosporofaciens TaxID=67327 RepID=A0A1H4VWC6_STRMJ|nr:hypothetical protein SAMN04490356_5801 [Streptomyces melanosporofaciens]